MEILELNESFERLRQHFVIITGYDRNDPSYISKKEEISTTLKEIRENLKQLQELLKCKKQQLEKDKILLQEAIETEKYIDYVKNNIPLQTEQPEPTTTEGGSFPQTNTLDPVNANDVSPYPSNWLTDLATPIFNTKSVLPSKKLSSTVSATSHDSTNFTLPSLSKATENLIAIPLVTASEFSTVPNYMKGRLTVDAVNLCIEAFNITLNKKYTIMSQKRKNLKHKEFDMYTEWKAQDDMKKDRWHCTPDDLVNLSGFKMEKSAYSIIVILRHLKRIQEVKMKGLKSRYIVN